MRQPTEQEVTELLRERLGGECRRVVDPWSSLPKENVG
jgi:hypothetical protein